MSRKTLHYSHRFHPVGQGLFCSGWLNLASHNKHRRAFSWVFDCGTSSSDDLLKRELRVLRSEGELESVEKPILDLVAISHFDHDHISGLLRLLKEYRIRRLILPYMPLWERVIVGIEEDDETVARFAINPVAFLQQAEALVDEILFIQPHGNGTSDETPTPQINDNDDDWIVTVEQSLDSTDRGEFFQSSDRRGGIAISFAESGGRISINGLWEFVPYNDYTVPVLSSGSPMDVFRRDVEELKDTLLSSPTHLELGALKSLYDKQFGAGPLERNVISLFLYAGPINHSNSEWCSGSGCPLSKRWHCCAEFGLECCIQNDLCSHKEDISGVLYTGDGYLKTPVQLSSLIMHLGHDRIRRTGCIQVMHHGSSNNWHSGVAAAINPRVSVFCSDPKLKRLGHPHAEVLRDFWLFNPVQVDKSHGLFIGGAVYFK